MVSSGSLSAKWASRGLSRSSRWLSMACPVLERDSTHATSTASPFSSHRRCSESARLPDLESHQVLISGILLIHNMKIVILEMLYLLNPFEFYDI